jgi:hypothetical protein
MSKASDSSGSLTIEDLERFIESGGEHKPQNITLVAPNVEIAKQWAEQYPGCTILLSAKYLPTKTKLTKEDIK